MNRTAEQGPHFGLDGFSVAADGRSYDTWFRAKVQEALDDPSPTTPHTKAMQDAQALIEARRQQKS